MELGHGCEPAVLDAVAGRSTRTDCDYDKADGHDQADSHHETDGNHQTDGNHDQANGHHEADHVEAHRHIHSDVLHDASGDNVERRHLEGDNLEGNNLDAARVTVRDGLEGRGRGQ